MGAYGQPSVPTRSSASTRPGSRARRGACASPGRPARSHRRFRHATPRSSLRTSVHDRLYLVGVEIGIPQCFDDHTFDLLSPDHLLYLVILVMKKLTIKVYFICSF